MVRALFGVAIGAVGALQAERWFEQRKQRFTPSAVTGSLIEQLNKRLETSREGKS